MLDVLFDYDLDAALSLELHVDNRASEVLGDLAMIMKENVVANFITETTATELTTMNLVDSLKIPLTP